MLPVLVILGFVHLHENYLTHIYLAVTTQIFFMSEVGCSWDSGTHFCLIERIYFDKCQQLCHFKKNSLLI